MGDDSQVLQELSVKRTYFAKHFKQISITPSYIVLAVLYGLSTLIVPFSVQVLVNNLALTGLWLSVLAYLVTITLVLAAAMTVKYFQIVLVEFMQRHIFFREVAKWQRHVSPDEIRNPYFFEIFNMMKSFQTVIGDGVDLGLRILFGGLALLFIHPAFIGLHVLLILSFFVLRWQGRGAIDSSLIESNAKYDLYYEIEHNQWSHNKPLVGDYLVKRDDRFGFIRRQTMTIHFTYVALQVLQLAWGVYLVQANQLAIGNLVSAEIILSGILYSYSEVPKMLEGFYMFETACIKVDSIKDRPPKDAMVIHEH